MRETFPSCRTFLAAPAMKFMNARRRAEAERLRVTSACDHCKKIKQKCDSTRPCSRCKRIGKDCEPTENEFPNFSLVERPMEFLTSNLDVSESTQGLVSVLTRTSSAKHDWSRRVIMKYSIAGYSSQIFLNIFNSLPEPLSSMMATLFKAQQKEISGFSSFGRVANQSRIALDNASAHFAADTSMWDSEQIYGFFEVWFDPTTATRQRVFMNTRFAQIHGFHKEELFARVANYDADLQRTEIDSLLLILDGLQNILDDSEHTAVERYYRLFSGPSRKPVLVWALWGKGFVQEGRYFKVQYVRLC